MQIGPATNNNIQLGIIKNMYIEIHRNVSFK